MKTTQKDLDWLRLDYQQVPWGEWLEVIQRLGGYNARRLFDRIVSRLPGLFDDADELARLREGLKEVLRYENALALPDDKFFMVMEELKKLLENGDGDG